MRVPIWFLRQRGLMQRLSTSFAHLPPRASTKSEPHARNECSVCAIRASPDIWVPYNPDARGPNEVTRQLAAAIGPRRRAGSCIAEMIRAAMASRKVRSGICEPENGSGTSNPSS